MLMRQMAACCPDRSNDEIDFGNVILEHLRTSGVQQSHKEDRLNSHPSIPSRENLFLAAGVMMNLKMKTLHKNAQPFSLALNTEHWGGLILSPQPAKHVICNSTYWSAVHSIMMRIPLRSTSWLTYPS